MKTIKIGWAGAGGDFTNPLSSMHFIYEFLERNYRVELSDNPDYLICVPTDFADLRFRDCVKIAFSIENIVPDFNRFDYVMAFDEIAFGDRYLRMPLFAGYDSYQLLKPGVTPEPADEDLLNRKFCSMVVSNSGGDPVRAEFFRRLCKYKKVDSGGRYLNNVGGPVKSKLDFCRRYKFNIAMENSVCPGYTTEKVMQPFAVHSVPIYYGNPEVGRDFNSAAMVTVKNWDDIDRAIEEIVALDQDDVAYLAKCRTPPLVHEWSFYHDRADAFLRNIFEQPLDLASRTHRFGFQPYYRHRLELAFKCEKLVCTPLRFMRRNLERIGVHV